MKLDAAKKALEANLPKLVRVSGVAMGCEWALELKPTATKKATKPILNAVILKSSKSF